MTDEPAPDDYALLPEVTHPQEREKLFLDAWRAMVRLLVESTGRPAAAYATDKSQLLLTEENQEIADPEASKRGTRPTTNSRT